MPEVRETHLALEQLRHFVALLRESLSLGAQLTDGGTWWFRQGEGSLWLSEAEWAQYRALVAGLARSYASKEQISVSAIQRVVQDCVFEALDLPKARRGEFDERLAEAIARVRRALTEKPIAHTCFIQVAPIEFGSEPARMGDVRFAAFDDEILTEINTLRRDAGGAELSSDVTGFLHRMGGWSQHVGIVTVPAQDFDAAQALATRRVEFAVDLVNSFGDLIPFNYGWMYLAGEAGSARRLTPMINERGDFVSPGEHLLPFAPFSWRNLERSVALKRAYERLHTLAMSAHRRSLGAALVTSAAWCGRGTVERRRNQAFLLFAIALETLLLAGNEREEISYRFRVRGAHLLANDRNRREVADDLKRLYNVRSKIAHAGSYDVREDDLVRIRTLAKSAVLRLLDKPDLHALKEDDIGRWLDSEVLGLRS